MALAKYMMGGGVAAGQAIAINGGAATIAVTTAGLAGGKVPTAAVNIVTGATGAGGFALTLPAGQPGDMVMVFNNDADTLDVFPPSGAAIAVVATGLGSANAAYAQTTYSWCTYVCHSATQWFVTKSA